MAPPDYETATKLNPPPDYDSAIKNYQMIPGENQVNNNITSVTEPITITDSHNNTIREGQQHHFNNSSHLQTNDYHNVNQLSGSGEDNKGSSSEKCSADKSSFSETTTSHHPPSSQNDSNYDSSYQLTSNHDVGGTNIDNSSSTCDTTTTHTTTTTTNDSS